VEVTSALQSAAAELAAAITQRDQEAFTALFEEVHKFLGSFTTEALQQSSYLVDRIVERG
jgi:chorismate mutase/prephenate dehydrogenase